MIPDLAAATRLIRRGRIITAVGLVGWAAVFVIALRYSPIDAIQGPAFRIIYLHVAAAWSMEIAVILLGIVGALYLWLRDRRLDLFGEASAEVGMVFGTIVLTTGPIWGKAVWGTWWEWEPRLTFTLLLYLLLAGYFALRSAFTEVEERGKFAAVVGIMALALIPFIHLAVYLWPTQHPQSVLLRPPTNDPNAPRLDWTVVRTILESLSMCTVLYVGFVTTRYGIGLRRAALEDADAE